MVALLAWPLVAAAAQSNYQLRPQDTLVVTVTDQPDLTSKFVIDDSGLLRFPLVGRVPAAGLTVAELTAELRRRLGEFLTNPEVRIAVERTRRIFVFGGVASPGMYQLTENMTLIELLARAGYGGASEALIIRTEGAVVPALPTDGNGPSGGDDDDTDVIRVNLRDLEKDLESGNLSRNIMLEEGDTIYIPRFDPNRIYVSGEVRNPGAYSVPEGTTLLQALVIAGGATQDAALNRIRVLRLVDGRQERIKVTLDDTIQPGDTILVPRRFF